MLRRLSFLTQCEHQLLKTHPCESQGSEECRSDQTGEGCHSEMDLLFPGNWEQSVLEMVSRQRPGNGPPSQSTPGSRAGGFWGMSGREGHMLSPSFRSSEQGLVFRGTRGLVFWLCEVGLLPCCFLVLGKVT